MINLLTYDAEVITMNRCFYSPLVLDTNLVQAFMNAMIHDFDVHQHLIRNIYFLICLLDKISNDL